MSFTYLQCGVFKLALNRPHIMAIINATPDSFSGDGVAGNIASALRQAETAIAEGAGILDIGGESTRPGARPVSEDEELARVLPVLEALLPLGVPISIDTSKHRVMREVVAAGASMINDVYGFRLQGAEETVAAFESVALCAMHLQGEPQTMQHAPRYVNVVEEVEAFLRERIKRLVDRGVAPERIAIDPGFGFGKTTVHNYTLLAHLNRLVDLGYPVLVGVSRKSMLAAITGRSVADRLVAGAVAALLAVQRGATLIRTHDVAATSDALKILQATEQHDGHTRHANPV